METKITLMISTDGHVWDKQWFPKNPHNYESAEYHLKRLFKELWKDMRFDLVGVPDNEGEIGPF